LFDTVAYPFYDAKREKWDAWVKKNTSESGPPQTDGPYKENDPRPRHRLRAWGNRGKSFQWSVISYKFWEKKNPGAQSLRGAG
jgi:hypothetical protein